MFYGRDDVSQEIENNGKKQEKTTVLIKTDAVRGGYMGDIIGRIDALDGARIVAMEMFTATREQCLRHYNKDDAWCERQGQRKIDQGLAESGLTALQVGRGILDLMADYMTSGPMIKLVIEGGYIIERMSHLVGTTEPVSAARETLRGAYSIDSYVLANSEGRALHNVAHCSDSPEEAEREIGIWFPKLNQEAA